MVQSVSWLVMACTAWTLDALAPLETEFRSLSTQLLRVEDTQSENQSSFAPARPQQHATKEQVYHMLILANLLMVTLLIGILSLCVCINKACSAKSCLQDRGQADSNFWKERQDEECLRVARRILAEAATSAEKAQAACSPAAAFSKA
mmetsp:Transcript_1001/g.2791  ORF Transcript_1001/g.2791 Transcript_1001/m.2791 type:complete len:148 (+) Transcript_1001:55-498(+)